MKKLKKSLFEKAMEWYKKGGDFKDAALELFTEKELESGFDDYKKCKRKADSREVVLEKLLDRCRDTFPIGTVVRNDEYHSLRDVEIIISEPYIGVSESGLHIPYGVYSFNTPDSQRKTILAKTLKLYHGEPNYNGHYPAYGVVGLEVLLEYIDKKYNSETIVDLDEYCKSELELNKEDIETVTNRIEGLRKDLKVFQNELEVYKAYDPSKLTKERVMQFVKEDEKRNKNE